MAHVLHKDEGEVRDFPFLRNDMKDHAFTMDRQAHVSDEPGKADAEIGEDEPE
ncbi:MAG: hypothetical protein ABL967_09075 [Bryobacteraceae bacterium]